MKKYIPHFLILPLFFLCFCSCTKNQEGANMTQQIKNFTVSVNEAGTEIKKRYPDKVRIKIQPIGVSFYKADWPEDAKGEILIQSGSNSFSIEDVMAFSGSEDSQSKEDGMSQLNIISGITGSKGISHHAAREKFISILEKIKKAGWRSIISFSSPRLAGKDRIKYMQLGHTIMLDADYPPSMDEWMTFPDLTTWQFYANHTFLKVNFMRDENKMDIAKPGAYVINYTLESEKDYFKGFVSPGEREKWDKLLPIELREAAEIRERTEEELRKNGWHIDTTYQDPPLPSQAANTTLH